MGTVRTGAVAAVVTLATLAACNSITGLDRDYELATASTPATIDGAVDGDDGGEPMRDASTAFNDGGADAAIVTGPVGCPSALPAGTIFCSDFEKSPLVGWSDIANANGAATSEVMPEVGRGNSRGLDSKVGSSEKSQSSAKVWTVNIGSWSVEKTLTMRFWFQIVSAGTYAEIGAVEFAQHEHGLAVYSDSGDCMSPMPCVDENDQVGGRGHGSSDGAFASARTWHFAVVTLTPHQGAQTVNFGGSVSVDGKVVYTTNSGAMPSGAVPSKFDIIVGAFYSAKSSSPTEVYIDDVLVTLEP